MPNSVQAAWKMLGAKQNQAKRKHSEYQNMMSKYVSFHHRLQTSDDYIIFMWVYMNTQHAKWRRMWSRRKQTLARSKEEAEGTLLNDLHNREKFGGGGGGGGGR